MLLKSVAKKARTVPKSFRIDEIALQAVEAEALTQSVSANTLVNQILRQFADFDRFARKINTVKVSSAVFRGVLSAGDADKIIEAAKQTGSSIPLAFATAKNGRVDQDGLLDHIRSFATYAHLCEVSETSGANGHVVTLTHDFGLNWSIFLVHYITAMFLHIGASLKLDMTDTSVVFTLPRT
jgi:hypothetical protein